MGHRPRALGYGLADIATTVAYGADPSDRYVTTWFRRTFDLTVTPNAFDAVSVHLRRDDGAVVYLNGVEILRDNLPFGAVTPDTLALDAVFGDAQDRFLDAVVPDGLLVEGENVVAVEVHQQSPASADLVLDLRLSGWDSPGYVVRGPYLQQPTPSGVIVRWRTAGPSAGRLWWGDELDALTQSVDDPVVGFEHELTITGAPVGGRVRYAVGTPVGKVLAGDDAEHVIQLPPPSSQPRPVRIWALGDSGTADANAEAVRDAYAQLSPDPLDTDLWLMLGDNAYPSGTLEQYDEAVFGIYPTWLQQVPLWPVFGNHDGMSADAATQSGPFFDLFTLPTAGECGGVASGTEAYFSFDYGPVHVIVLDSTDSDRSATGAMATWARADLAALGSQTDWVVAAFHHPPYSHGSHNSDTELNLVQMRENLLPILEEGGVDLVLSGHSHSYERSVLLDGYYGDSTALEPAMVRQGHDGDPLGDGPYTKWPEQVEPHEGAVYVVAGSSGQVSGGLLDHPAMYVSLNALGSLVLDVDGGLLEGRFLDDAGAILDTFAIEKGRTTVVSIDGPRLVASGEDLALTGLAREPDGSEVATYRWDWGDGAPPAFGNPATHAFASEGTYTVTLTATDHAGEEATAAITVAVDDYDPVIDRLEASADPTEGAPVTFTGHATDAGGDPLTYLWTIGTATYAGDQVVHTFLEDGPYTATLTVTDDAGRQDPGCGGGRRGERAAGRRGRERARHRGRGVAHHADRAGERSRGVLRPAHRDLAAARRQRDHRHHRHRHPARRRPLAHRDRRHRRRGRHDEPPPRRAGREPAPEVRDATWWGEAVEGAPVTVYAAAVDPPRSTPPPSRSATTAAPPGSPATRRCCCSATTACTRC
ncbi:MAG: PKD domain-containing protein [Myxococcota bacterium]